MCFSLCKRAITLDILLPIFIKWNLKLRLLSSVRPRKLNSFIYSMGDSFKSKVLLFVACEITLYIFCGTHL